MIHLLSLLTLLLVWYAFAMRHYSKDSLRNNVVISQVLFYTTMLCLSVPVDIIVCTYFSHDSPLDITIMVDWA